MTPQTERSTTQHAQAAGTRPRQHEQPAGSGSGSPQGDDAHTQPRGVRKLDDPPLQRAVNVVAGDADRRRKLVAGLRWTLVTVFALAGATKVLGLEAMATRFQAWGYPPWMLYAVGAVELVAAALVATRKTRLGSGVVMIVMAGAIGTHLLAGEWLLAIVPLLVLLGAFTLMRLSALPRTAGAVARESSA